MARHYLRRDGTIETITDAEDLALSVKPATDELNRADAAWQGNLWRQVGKLIGCILRCFPLFLRVFIRAERVRAHGEHAAQVTGVGVLILVIYALGGIMGFHAWSLGLFSWLGIDLAAFGLVTLAVAAGHLAIADRHPARCHGNGFGLLNVHALFSGREPHHVWTWLQDGACVGYGLYVIRSAPEENRAWTALLVVGVLAMGLGYTWYSQSQSGDDE